MKRFVCILAFMFLATIVIGCASTSSAKFGSDNISGLNGKTEQQIIAQFGKPYKKFNTSNGDKVLEYRQPAEESSWSNTVVALHTAGSESGANSAYVDIMIIYLKKDTVTKATFENNVSSKGR